MQRTRANRKSTRQHKPLILLSVVSKMVQPNTEVNSVLTRKSIKGCNGELHIYKLQVLTESVECDAGVCGREERGRGTVVHLSM